MCCSLAALFTFYLLFFTIYLTFLGVSCLVRKCQLIKAAKRSGESASVFSSGKKGGRGVDRDEDRGDGIDDYKFSALGRYYSHLMFES